MLYKVIEEYDRFYLCESVDYGYKECFNKPEYVTSNGFIKKKKLNYFDGQTGAPTDKINKAFNNYKTIKNKRIWLYEL